MKPVSFEANVARPGGSDLSGVDLNSAAIAIVFGAAAQQSERRFDQGENQDMQAGLGHVNTTSETSTPAAAEGLSSPVVPTMPAGPGRSAGRIIVTCFGIAVCAGAYVTGFLPIAVLEWPFGAAKPLADTAKPEARKVEGAGAFRPTEAHWQTMTVESVTQMPFRTTLVTDGKIAIDEDHTTPVFSPYAGRVMKLYAKPGDKIEQGKPLFDVEASDMVQGQNDFLAGRANLNKAISQLKVAEVVLKRHRDLILTNAVAKRDL